jgi:hypothetical protein
MVEKMMRFARARFEEGADRGILLCIRTSKR